MSDQGPPHPPPPPDGQSWAADTPSGTPKPPPPAAPPTWYPSPGGGLPPGGAPDLGSKHEIPAYTPARDSRLDKIFLAIAGGLFTISVAVGSWIFGNLHARLDKAEGRLTEAEKADIQYENDIKNLKEQNAKQWELIGQNGRGLAGAQEALNRLGGGD